MLPDCGGGIAYQFGDVGYGDTRLECERDEGVAGVAGWEIPIVFFVLGQRFDPALPMAAPKVGGIQGNATMGGNVTVFGGEGFAAVVGGFADGADESGEGVFFDALGGDAPFVAGVEGFD